MKTDYLTKKTVLFFVFILILFLNASFDLNINVYIFAVCSYLYFVTQNLAKIYISDKFFFWYSLYIVFLIFLGLSNNNFLTYLYFDIISFAAFLFISISFQYKRTYFFITYFPKIGVIINTVAIVFCFFHLFKNGINFASMDTGRGLENLKEGQIMSPKYYLYTSLFLYPLRNYIVIKKQIYIYNISIALFILFSLAMASRGTTVIGVIVVVLTYLQRNKIKIRFQNLFNKNFLKYLFISFISFLLMYQIPKISAAITFLIYRFTDGEESLGASRTQEASEIYQSLSFNELIFGRGLGASNTYWIFNDVEHGVNNAHYGWIFLILKGGVLLVILIYLKIIISIYQLQKSNYMGPYAIILISFLMLEYAHTNFNAIYNLSFMFIALSATSIIKNSNENKSFTY